MSPEAIIADLRDVHLPPDVASAPVSGFSSAPLALFGLLTLCALWLTWRRRNLWRRQALATLSTIEQLVDTGDAEAGWRTLAQLLRQLAILQHHNGEATAATGEPWLRLLDRMFADSRFSNGIGRGLLHYPYGSVDAAGAEQLRAICQLVREKLPRLSPVAVRAP